MEQPNFIEKSKEEKIKNFVKEIGTLLIDDPTEALEKVEEIPDFEIRQGIWKEFIKNEKFNKFWDNIQPLLSYEERERMEKFFGKIVWGEQVES